MAGVSNGSKKLDQTEHERALNELLPLAAKFQRLFSDAMTNSETGFVILRVEYDRGNVTQMYVENRDVKRPLGRDQR